jgi:DNA-binding NarL/FixJ family response regulator
MTSLVVIADESSIVGQIRLAARYAAGVSVVAAIDGRAAIGNDIAALEPDVVLVGEMCQRVNTLSRLKEVNMCLPAATVLLLVSGNASSSEHDAFAAGAHAVLTRELGAPALGAMIGAIALGQLVLSGHRPPEGEGADDPDGAALATVEHLRLVPDQEARWAGTSA